MGSGPRQPQPVISPALPPAPKAPAADDRSISSTKVSATKTSSLELLPTSIRDPEAWAKDIDSAIKALGLPSDPSMLCAAIAVIEQESSWQAEPTIPGLPSIVLKEIEKRRARYGVPQLLLDAALSRPSPDGRTYHKRIALLRTERQMSRLFDDMISELPYGRVLLSDKNPVRTGGPMQVSFSFAEAHTRERPYPYPFQGSLREEVFSRRGGVYFGIANLLDYPVDYPQLLYRFADFNAGRYSSRNAALQAAITRLSGEKLSFDGDLLGYTNGRPSNQISQTQAAILKLGPKLGLSRAQISKDLAQEKSPGLESTATWQRIFALADQTAGRPLPRQRLPGIDLKSPKIQRKLTTAWFAQRVDGRYQSCLVRSRENQR